MGDDEPRIDEDCRRRFEAHRLAGGHDPLADFLPPPDATTRADTLEELLLIELELHWKRWDGTSDPPDAHALVAAHGELTDDAARRVHDEAALLRARFARRLPVGPGVRFDRYTLKARVGRGASAEVWRAVDETLQRDVAVKLAREELVGDALVTARLVREAQSTAQLRHPAIVTVHEVSERSGQPYIVSDFIEGPTLAAEIERRSFSSDEAAAVVARLADALDYAHTCGVVHRDVKPGNVLLPAPGRPVLTDFGLAQLARAEIGLTRQGDVLGTPAYMAPEQARGDVDQVDARTDVYALGAMLYELMTGRRPFAGASAASVLYAVVHRDPEPAGAVKDGLPGDLVTICNKAMAREPARRYARARDLADDLRRFLAREPILARPPGPLRRAALWVRRNPALAATLAGSVAVVVVVTAVAFARVLDERDQSRIERDRAEGNLYRALVGEVDARLAALDTGWYTRSLDAVREASQLRVESHDVVALRGLVARCEGVPSPCFAEGPIIAGRGAVRALAELGGDRVAGASAPDRVWVRSLPDGAVTAERRLEGDDLRVLLRVAGGAALVVAGDAGRVHTLRPDTLATLSHVDLGSEVWCGDVTPEGVTVGLADGRVVAFDVDTTGALGRSTDGPRLERGVLALSVSRDGARLATSDESGLLAIHDAHSGALLESSLRVDAARTLRFAPDGAALAFAAYENLGFGLHTPNSAWDDRAGFHESAVRDLVFAGPDRIVSASSDGTLRAWSRAFAPLAVAETSGAASAVQSVSATPDGRRVVAGHADGSLRLWTLRQSDLRADFRTPQTAAFRPDTPGLFTGHVFLDFAIDDGPLRVQGTRAPAPAARHSGQVWGAAVSPDGRLAASCGHTGSVLLLDAHDGSLAATLTEGEELAWVVTFSPDSRTLAAGIGDEVVLFDVDTHVERARFDDHDRLVTGIAFAPTRPLLATTSLDGTLRLYDTTTQTLLATLADRRTPLYGAAFAGDGSRLAVTGADGLLRLFDVDAALTDPGGEPLARLAGHSGAVWGVTFSPDGSLLATCDDRGRTLLRDAATLAPLVTLESDVRRARTLSFGDGGRLLAVGCYNGRSVVWDLLRLRRRFAEFGLDW